MSEASTRSAVVAAPARRPWQLACVWLAFLGPFSIATYLGAHTVTSWRADVPAVVFAWERHIPFLAWTVVPYWSLNALYVASLFLARHRDELNTLGRRLLTAQLIAVLFFLVSPLRLTSTIPEDTGIFAPLFRALEFSNRFNMAPSLHIGFLVILWAAYSRLAPSNYRWLVHLGALLIGTSVLTARQHHFVDVPTGALLGLACLRLWPDRGGSYGRVR